jgi:membrane associated rhomboid family serine protease
LALIPKLFAGLSQSGGAYAFGHVMGSIVGILLASAISIALFRSALR